MRIKIFALILGLCSALLLSGLSHLQILHHQKYRTMAEENRLKVVPLTAPRGGIFDRKGRELVKDVLSFDLSVVHYRISDMPATVEFLAGALDLDAENISTRLEQARRTPFRPVVIVSDLGIDKAIVLKERASDFPGVRLEPTARREYVHGSLAAHVIGYLGMINRQEYERLGAYGYRMDDLIGRDGLERQYEDYLRGRHGGKQIEVDHRGRIASVLGYKQPRQGNDIFLSLDLDLQKFCEEAIAGRKGSIIAMVPSSGEILAMASAPSYDPGTFVPRREQDSIRDLLKSEEFPLMNRATRGEYPPGSVFKLAVAAGALSSGAISPDTVFDCRGQFQLGGIVFRCWFARGHGPHTLADAIKHSCNVYFYETGLRTGVETISRYSKMMGFGETSGVDLPFERSATLPSPDWKTKALGQSWYRGDTVNLSIGQGYLTVTPLQVARMTSVFANGGKLPRPYLVRSIAGAETWQVQVKDLGLSEEMISVVREGMRAAVNDRRGTGINARSRFFIISGKTGTAQPPRGENHGWFAGFAPFDEPALVVVVFDEHGGRGGHFATETAGKVFEKANELGLFDIALSKKEEG